MRPGEVPDSVVKADTSTLNLLGLSAGTFVSLKDGIRETVAWFVENEDIHWSKP